METCPVGFFCFDKNTFLLIILSLIILVVYQINKSTSKYEIQKNNLKHKTELIQLIKGTLTDKTLNNNTSNDIQKLKKENLHLEIKNSINQNNQNNINEQRYIVNKDYQRVINPLLPPERSFPNTINRIGIPINIPTRGHSSSYQQIGALIQEGDNLEKKILPLFGKPTYVGSRQWQYYTSTDSFTSVKLSVIHENKSCQDEYGCREIMDGSIVKVNGYGFNFKASIYNIDKPKYLPYVF